MNKHEQYSIQQKYLQQYSTTGLVPVFNMQNCNITIEIPSYQPPSYQPQNPKKRRLYIYNTITHTITYNILYHNNVHV